MALRKSTETRILDAAEELFFSQGVAATPIDTVIARAGVSAATLYRGYSSKEALLAAALDRRQSEWIDLWDSVITRKHTDESRLLAVFDALDEFRQRPHGARWCSFLGSAAEYVNAPEDVADALRMDTDTLRRRLTELAVPVAADNASALAGELLLVITGSLAMRLREPEHSTSTARRIAAVLIQNYSLPSNAVQ